MIGEAVIARTISVPTKRGKNSEKLWQHHGRSDAHSKIACWAVLADLYLTSEEFSAQVHKGKISFAINHKMVGPALTKKLDLVVCRPSRDRQKSSRRTFATLGKTFGVQLLPQEESQLVGLNDVEEERTDDVSQVLIAVEAKASFTNLVGSIPRLHAEILATGFLAKQASASCLTVSHTLINGSMSFISPSNEKPKRRKPSDSAAVLKMLRGAVPRIQSYPFGYDAVGATILDCKNDGSVVTVIPPPMAPSTDDPLNYRRMVVGLAEAFDRQFKT